MPLIDVKCGDCGEVEERLLMPQDRDACLEACRGCGGDVIKLVSAPNIMFASGGWAGEEIRAHNKVRKIIENAGSKKKED